MVMRRVELVEMFFPTATYYVQGWSSPCATLFDLG